MENMKGLFSGNKTLYIHADYAKDMRKARKEKIMENGYILVATKG